MPVSSGGDKTDKIPALMELALGVGGKRGYSDD